MTRRLILRGLVLGTTDLSSESIVVLQIAIASRLSDKLSRGTRETALVRQPTKAIAICRAARAISQSSCCRTRLLPELWQLQEKTRERSNRVLWMGARGQIGCCILLASVLGNIFDRTICQRDLKETYLTIHQTESSSKETYLTITLINH